MRKVTHPALVLIIVICVSIIPVIRLTTAHNEDKVVIQTERSSKHILEYLGEKEPLLQRSKGRVMAVRNYTTWILSQMVFQNSGAAARQINLQSQHPPWILRMTHSRWWFRFSTSISFKTVSCAAHNRLHLYATGFFYSKNSIYPFLHIT